MRKLERMNKQCDKDVGKKIIKLLILNIITYNNGSSYNDNDWIINKVK